MENKTTKQIGDEAEQIAANFLISQGLKNLHKNYKTRFGEIDLIAQDANATLIFVEVRFRKFDKYQKFGNSAESITFKKQQKIIKAAQEFLTTLNKTNKMPFCRFDCVLFDCQNNQKNITPKWIKNAFLAE